MTTQLIPLSEIGLDLRPIRQVRALDEANVHHLMTETDPAEWDPILVRAWPTSDPFPDGPHPEWQVISGYHRTSAARLLHLAEIRAIVRDDIDTDAKFLGLAMRENQRHGHVMSGDEKRAVCAQLQALGMSIGAIAKETSIPKSTVSAWLSGRDTNASKPMPASRQASSTSQSNASGGLWVASTNQPSAYEGVPLRARDATQVGVAWGRMLATNLPGLRVTAVQAWLAQQDGDERVRCANSALALTKWLMAFADEALRLRATPEEIAEARRAVGMSMDDIINTMFGEDAFLDLMLRHASSDAAQESEGVQ
jgi:ParB/Sulfiredoxin domain